VDVILPLEVREYSFGGFSLGLWVGEIDEMEENSIKSRRLIAELTQLLERKVPTALILPLAEPDELIVEASLEWGGHQFHLVFNTFDGVVALEHEERAPLVELMGFVSGAVRVI
jgi:hypothetical protein